MLEDSVFDSLEQLFEERVDRNVTLVGKVLCVHDGNGSGPDHIDDFFGRYPFYIGVRAGTCLRARSAFICHALRTRSLVMNPVGDTRAEFTLATNVTVGARENYTGVSRTPIAMTAVKIIRVMGTSEESWEDAAHEAFREASQTVDDISGINVERWTATVEDDEIVEYKVTTEIAFPVEY
ncbi:Flavin-binding protein dodecin [Halostagnicola kamekurae]|uniref:Flavin-binding protein dodecin n=2 Tax=Halostagnicola kamekurae TaxID=619731 RepID=A0A1I6TEZ3_9EURY|nr:Flavin-binding protein dodecin [Halostagnicola kamekurae]